jgi:transposase/IS5 family transposase
MATRFVNIDRQTALLLPPDLKEWVADNDLAKFVLEAVEVTDTAGAALNVRGSGSEQYPPAMMLALLIYCYATGIFSSRRIERATFDSVAVRYLCANTHPDHDTIATFRRSNEALLRSCFVSVLELAKESGLLKLGSVSLDGTKLLGSASKGHTFTSKQLEEQIAGLEKEVGARLEKAEQADASTEEDGYTLPQSHGDGAQRLLKLKQAKARLEERAKKKVSSKKGPPPGAGPPPPSRRQRAARINLTDSESALMPTREGVFIQGYNAQALIDGDGVGLIAGAHVVNATNDRQQLVAGVASIPATLPRPAVVLADKGYDNAAQIEAVEKGGQTLVYCQPQSKNKRPAKRTYRLSLQRQALLKQREKMRARLAQAEGARLYARRQGISEAPFHVIKNILGFRRFSLRGLSKVNLEWLLVALAYNCRKLAAAAAA